MAKGKRVAKGKSVSDILNMDYEMFNKLTEREMRQAVQQLSSAANKRLKVFEKSGDSSPAVRYVNQSGGKFSTKGKNLNSLRSEYMRAKKFLESRTSSRREWNRVKKDTLSTLKSKYNINISKENFDKFWKSYEKLKEISPEVSIKSLKYVTLKNISSMVDDKVSEEDIANLINSQLTEAYEELENLDTDAGGVSKFFEI